jgi:hypothetical protein
MAGRPARPEPATRSGYTPAAVAKRHVDCGRRRVGPRRPEGPAALHEQDVEVWLVPGPWAPVRPPTFPHVIVFWDHSSELPLGEFSYGATELVAVGAKNIFFNGPIFDSSTFKVVIAPIYLSPSVATEWWSFSVAEMPSPGGDLVSWDC